MEQPIRASFTGRNTVNQPLRTRDINSFNKIPVKGVLGDVPVAVQPIQQSIKDAQDPLQLQESLDIALMQMKQHEEESDAEQLRNRVAHTAEFLASNRVVIDAIKSGLLEQREGELDVASTEGLEGTLLLDARKQQLMEREVLEGLRATQREQAEEAAKIETEIKGTQQQHEKTLEELEWQHASFFTQLQELQGKQTAIVRREELTEDELREDRADILVMKAQHEVHREHLASQEVEMFRIDTTQKIGESVSAQEFGRLNEQFANVASAIADFEESQDWQSDQVRNTETTVGRLDETTDRTSSCVKTLLAAAENIGRGHNMITTLARQQDVVEMQQRVKVMSDLKIDFQQNDATMDRLIRQHDRVSERTKLVNDRLNGLEEAVKVAYEVLNRQEDKLNLERERAQVKEISLAKSAGHAILMLREAIVEARTLLEQSETDVERLERVCLSLRRIARDFTAAMQQDIEIINDEIQRADDIVFNLTSKIEWFQMVSAQKNRQLALQQQQFLSQRNEVPSVRPVGLHDDFVEEDEPAVVLVDLGDNGTPIACRILRADDIQSTTQTERSRRQQLLDRAVAEQQAMAVEDEYDESEEDEEIEGDGSAEYIVMNVFTPEYYASGLTQECA